jgi:DNA-binding MarR family transcriptional regulator
MIHNLLSVSQRLQANRRSHARMLGMSGVQYTVLTAIAHLQGDEGVSVNAVARHLHLSPSFVTMEIAKMVALGVVDKSQDSTDKRRVQLTVSDRGWELLDAIIPIQRPVNDALFEGLTHEDFVAFCRIIATIADNAERASALLELLKHARPGTAGLLERKSRESRTKLERHASSPPALAPRGARSR